MDFEPDLVSYKWAYCSAVNLTIRALRPYPASVVEPVLGFRVFEGLQWLLYYTGHTRVTVNPFYYCCGVSVTGLAVVL